MKLTKVVLKGYRSIKQEATLLVDDRVTILIGANDHGKSNLLEAIRCLNDDNRISPDDRNWDMPEDSTVEIRWHFAPNEAYIKLGHKGFSWVKEKQDTDESLAANEPDDEGNPNEPAETSAPGLAAPRYFPVNESREIIYKRDSVTNKVQVESLPTMMPRIREQEILSLRPQVQLFEAPTGNVIDR